MAEVFGVWPLWAFYIQPAEVQTTRRLHSKHLLQVPGGGRSELPRSQSSARDLQVVFTQGQERTSYQQWVDRLAAISLKISRRHGRYACRVLLLLAERVQHTLADPASVDLSTQLPAIIRLGLTVVHVVRGEMDEDV